MTPIQFVKDRFGRYHFLLSELIKRDFNSKYKRTYLGVMWSLINPLAHVLIMTLVFVHFFGSRTPNFVIHVFSGQLIFGFFSSATNQGMSSLSGNAGLITKVSMPKWIFLISKNMASLIELLTTLVIFFIFVAIEGIAFRPQFLLLVYPIMTLILFNIGVGLILSVWHVFFKDVGYLYSIFTQLLMFMSAIFWPIENFSQDTQRLFMFNPIFAHIHYFRLVVLHGLVPTANVHLLLLGFAIAPLVIGSLLYKKYNGRLVYYM